MAIVGPTTYHPEIRRWAESQDAVPVEVLPGFVNGEPALLRLMRLAQVTDRANVRVVSWEDFFAKFDALRLSFVYDDDSTGYNEILQREEPTTQRRPKAPEHDQR